MNKEISNEFVDFIERNNLSWEETVEYFKANNPTNTEEDWANYLQRVRELKNNQFYLLTVQFKDRKVDVRVTQTHQFEASDFNRSCLGVVVNG